MPTPIYIAGLPTLTINQLGAYSGSFDPVNDLFVVYENATTSTVNVSRNTALGLSSAPLGLTDSQSPTNKTFNNTNVLTVKDSNLTLQDNGDVTKQAQFQLSGITTGNTRTYTVPDYNATLATLAGTETFTNKTLTSPTINAPTITNANISADALSGFTTSNSGTIYGISIAAGVITSITALGPNTVTSTSVASGALSPLKTTYPYKFLAYRNASLSQTSNSIIVFDTKTGTGYDTGSNYSVSTGLFTAPANGYYKFDTTVSFTSGAFIFAVSLQKNGSGTLITGGQENNLSGSVAIVNSFPLIPLTAGDTIGVYFGSTNSGSTAINVGSSVATWFSGYLASTS